MDLTNTPDLGKPYIDINAPLDCRPPSEVHIFETREQLKDFEQHREEAINDLARYKDDKINPSHYKHHGIECIEMTRHMGFREGNIVKYVYRWQKKGQKEDLKKARWYIDDLLSDPDHGC